MEAAQAALAKSSESEAQQQGGGKAGAAKGKTMSREAQQKWQVRREGGMAEGQGVWGLVWAWYGYTAPSAPSCPQLQGPCPTPAPPLVAPPLCPLPSARPQQQLQDAQAAMAVADGHHSTLKALVDQFTAKEGPWPEEPPASWCVVGGLVGRLVGRLGGCALAPSVCVRSRVPVMACARPSRVCLVVEGQMGHENMGGSAVWGA